MVNAAYSKGGAQAALSTLNTNLDLNLTDYIVVNFNGLSEIIDLMGGVDIKFTLDTPTINGASLVVPAGLSGNVTALHEFLFDDSDYKPTKKVDAINKKIIEKTGIQPITPDLEQNEK